MKKYFYLILLFLAVQECAQVQAQAEADHFTITGVQEKVAGLGKIAILPFWVELDPRRYENLTGARAAKQADAALFWQNLLYAALLRHDHGKKLRDIYAVNEQLARYKADLQQLPLSVNTSELCKGLGVDALLLGYISYNNSFLDDQLAVRERLKTIPWAQPPKNRNVVLVLWHKDGYPLWACALKSPGIKATVRQETQLWIGEVVGLHGYKAKP